MPERRTLYDGDEAIYPRTIASEVYVSDGVTFEDEIAENLALVKRAEQVLIDGIKDYKTYTVRIDLNNSDPETACEYMDNAVGMTPGYDGWKDTEIIKNIKPCVLNNGEVQYYLQKDNYTLKEDGTASVLDGTDGDVMVEIPKIGYKLWNDENYQYVSVTEDPNKDEYCYYAHSLNSVGDCSKLYIGAYLSNMNGRSYSGQTPGYKLDLNENRDLATTIGSNYSLFSFYSLTLLQCLYVIIYKNLNSQTALGQGYTRGDGRINTGGTNSNTFCYGSFISGSQQVKFLGIEDFYGNELYWVDGLYCDDNMNIKTDYKNSVFTGSNGNNFQFSTTSGLTSNIGGYISQIQGTNETGFIPRVTSGGSTNTYYCDRGDLAAGYFGCFGGGWDDVGVAGAFRLDVAYSASNAFLLLEARLQYKQLAN